MTVQILKRELNALHERAGRSSWKEPVFHLVHMNG